MCVSCLVRIFHWKTLISKHRRGENKTSLFVEEGSHASRNLCKEDHKVGQLAENSLTSGPPILHRIYVDGLFMLQC